VDRRTGSGHPRSGARGGGSGSARAWPPLGRGGGDKAGARWLKGARWALWKRPERLTERQQAKLSQIAKINERLYRAYLLKEQLRLVFHEQDTDAAVELLDGWLAWARRCRIESFVKLAKTISASRAGIVATLTHRLSNARVEAINTTLRLITRRAYGFHSAEALIALAMLTVSGLRPPLPGRA
jgi:transposase